MPAHYLHRDHIRDTVKRPSAKYGKTALWLILLTTVLPVHVLLILELFHAGSLGLILILVSFVVYVGLPCCMVSLVLAITGIVRKECSLKPAVIAVAVSIIPVLFGLWILFNYLTMGEPW